MQIIYAHRKSFDADQYAGIKYNFSSFERNMATVCSLFIYLFKFLSYYGFLTVLVVLRVMGILKISYVGHCLSVFLII